MDTTTPRSYPVTGDHLAWAFWKLSAAFPSSFPADAAIEAKGVLWFDLLEANPWITAGVLDIPDREEDGSPRWATARWIVQGVFNRGIREISIRHKGNFLPEPATALDYFHQAKADHDKGLARLEAEQRAKLPPPKPSTSGWNAMSGPERAAFFERNLAIGKLKARGVVEPTEQEIGGQLKAQRATRFCHGTLEAIAAREDAPLADIGKEVTGAWPR